VSERGQHFPPSAKAQSLADTAWFGEQRGAPRLCTFPQHVRSTQCSESAPGAGGKASSTGIRRL